MAKSKLNDFPEYTKADIVSGKVGASSSGKGSYLKPQTKPIYINCPFGNTEQVEKEVVKECKNWLIGEGLLPIEMYTGGKINATHLGANEAKGCPDYIVFDFPKKRKFWIEFKRNKGGKIDQDQQNWHSWLRHTGDTVIIACSLAHLQDQCSKLLD